MVSKKRRHPPRVLPTFAKLVAVAEEHVEPGGVYMVAVRHDDGCPALRSQRLLDCVCEAWVAAPRRLA